MSNETKNEPKSLAEMTKEELERPDLGFYRVLICDDCIRLKGQMCHRPECVFCRRTMREVGEFLDALLIRPIVNGKRFDTEYAFSLKEKLAERAEARRLREALEQLLLWLEDDVLAILKDTERMGISWDAQDRALLKAEIEKARAALTPATPEAGKALQPTPEGGTK